MSLVITSGSFERQRSGLIRDEKLLDQQHLRTARRASADL
jgi:hypothetical protein